VYDIAIIGAGPAGATLARMVGKSYNVLLIDKRQLTSPASLDSSVKCCGGLLAPDAQQMLATLGLGLPQHVLTGPQVFVVRAVDLQHRLERYYQRHYINIHRDQFDRWLVSLVPPSVDIRPGCLFRYYDRGNNAFKINLSQSGRMYTEHAKILIGADGASSTVRKLAFPGRPCPKVYVAIQEWVTADEALPYYSAMFDREITDYYCWAIPKEKSLVIGAALLPGPKAPGRFELLKKKVAEFGFQFGQTIKKRTALLRRPMKTSQVCIGGSRIALLGEAAGWISPSSAEGISYAFKSATILAGVLKEGPDNFLKRYDKKAKHLRRNILLKTFKARLIYNRWFRRAAMVSGINSLKIHK